MIGTSPGMSSRPSADELKLEQAKQAQQAQQGQAKAPPPPVQRPQPGRKPLFRK